jgi:acyl-CoA synthetase (AMP-forming)/AMP-acid ligase II
MMEITLKHRNLIELFNRSLAAVTPLDKICVEIIRPDRHETMTFRQLKERAEAFATWLLNESGLHHGDKVALVSKNRTDWDVALWGTILAGMIPVLIDPERGPQGNSHLLSTDARGRSRRTITSMRTPGTSWASSPRPTSSAW